MLETFTVETFSPRVGDTFRIVHEGKPVLELTLESAIAYGSESAKEWSKASGRAPFSLKFVGPRELVLPQRIYRLEHEEMEAFEIFLVPVGPNQVGMRYEAIFT